ncbi:MAG TPA: squalene/phytoene synthase family protein [Terriglobales bacterium]|nr:squalene/phytoene synthase family protein [Terriglobales bacterium]
MSRAWDGLERPAGAAAPELREAERFCQQMARREAGNFYWGFISLPHDQRVAIYALYDFARQVDDEADAAGRPHLAASLERHRQRARDCAAGEASDPVGLVLSHALRRYAIPETELLALIDGVQTDLTRTRYATWTDLEAYCRLVASTIGRMCVRIFGFEDPVALDRADDLGVALQLTNILRDVKEDGELGRVYLPGQDLERFGVAEADLLNGVPGPGWERLVDFEARRARARFATGLEVLRFIPRRPAVCVATMAGIYRRILGMVERDPWLPLRRRASLSPAAKAAVMVRSWAAPRG